MAGEKIKVEVCVETTGCAIVAEQAGADRVELNSAIGLGGLTPTVELLKQVKSKVSLPVVCMVRPRPGDFTYSDNEFELMLAEGKALLSQGADGLVVGCLQTDGTVDRKRIEDFRNVCANGELVFHRAIDCVVDPFQSVKDLVELGVDRVLTSGGEETAVLGLEVIRELQDSYGTQIEILPGSGIRSTNVADLVSKTRCHQIHGTFSHTVNTGAETSPLNFNQVLGLESNQKKVASLEEIEEVVRHLKRLSQK